MDFKIQLCKNPCNEAKDEFNQYFKIFEIMETICIREQTHTFSKKFGIFVCASKCYSFLRSDRKACKVRQIKKVIYQIHNYKHI